jgi:hypothetical protein
MAKDRSHIEAVLAAIARSDERSTLFHWMHEHHDELVAAAAGHRMRWKALTARLAEAGLRDATGKPATERTARETWYQVRRVVAKRRAAQAALHSATNPTSPPQADTHRMPSKTAPGRRPIEVEITTHPRASTGPSLVSASRSGASPEVAPQKRQLRVFRSLADIKPPQQSTEEPVAAPEPGSSGMLPPPTWPKPVL